MDDPAPRADETPTDGPAPPDGPAPVDEHARAGERRDYPTMWDLLRARVTADPDGTALLDDRGRQLTFGAWRDRAEQVAAGFHGRGVEPGTPVTWQLPTTLEAAVVSLALCRLGAVQNPLLPIYGEREVGVALREVEPRLVVTDPQLPTGDPSTLPPAPAGPGADEEVRWISYTSGTTSAPKGARHTDRSLISAGRAIVRAHAMTTADVGSIAFPIAHAGGAQYLAAALLVGFPVVLVERFAPAEAARLFRELGVTMTGGSTAFYQAFLAEQRRQPEIPLLPGLRLMSGGGAPKPPELFDAVLAEIGCPIYHGFGMTEAPQIAMGATTHTNEQLAHTEGLPVRGVEIRVVAPDGTPAQLGVDGAVLIRGDTVCVGYTDPELTATAFDTDGFLHTGDIGHFRPDGHLCLTGRAKDIIIRKGENISAPEVETLLATHPRVDDVAVIGLPEPDRGEIVCAVLEQPAEAAELQFDEMVAFLREAGLMRQKIPERLEIVTELPRNALRKVAKGELRQRYAGPGRH